MIAKILADLPLVLAVGVSVISEVISIRQQLKYPDNDGFGGVLAGLLKLLQSLKS